jgi:hypothetical protein
MLMRMALRSLALAASACLVLTVGCDDPAPPAATPSTATPASQPAAAANTSGAQGVATVDGPRERLVLGAIPFSIEVPKGWSLMPGVTGRMVLHGRAPSGELDVLLGMGPNIKGDALPMMLKQSAKASNDPHVKSEVTQRDGLTLVQNIAPQTPPNTPAASDPELVPMGWSVQAIVSDGKLDYSVYELTFLGLSQAMFDKDEAFLRQLISTLRYDGAATQPATP